MQSRFLILSAMLMLPACLAHAQGNFIITSPTLKDGATMSPDQILNGFGCHGSNRSPALSWTAPPPGTKSLAITMYDPDAPTGSGWWHWTVFNLSPSTRALSEAEGEAGGAGLPSGVVQGQTDFGTSGYGGPCPPVGDQPHHYIITIWALDIERLPLDKNAPGALVGFFLHKHEIGKATLTVRYQR